MSEEKKSNILEKEVPTIIKYSEIKRALKYNNEELVLNFINNNNIDVLDNFKYEEFTLLGLALYYNNLTIIKLLIKKGINIQKNFRITTESPLLNPLSYNIYSYFNFYIMKLIVDKLSYSESINIIIENLTNFNFSEKCEKLLINIINVIIYIKITKPNNFSFNNTSDRTNITSDENIILNPIFKLFITKFETFNENYKKGEKYKNIKNIKNILEVAEYGPLYFVMFKSCNFDMIKLVTDKMSTTEIKEIFNKKIKNNKSIVDEIEDNTILSKNLIFVIITLIYVISKDFKNTDLYGILKNIRKNYYIYDIYMQYNKEALKSLLCYIVKNIEENIKENKENKKDEISHLIELIYNIKDGINLSTELLHLEFLLNLVYDEYLSTKNFLIIFNYYINNSPHKQRGHKYINFISQNENKNKIILSDLTNLLIKITIKINDDILLLFINNGLKFTLENSKNYIETFNSTDHRDKLNILIKANTFESLNVLYERYIDTLNPSELYTKYVILKEIFTNKIEHKNEIGITVEDFKEKFEKCIIYDNIQNKMYNKPENEWPQLAELEGHTVYKGTKIPLQKFNDKDSEYIITFYNLIDVLEYTNDDCCVYEIFLPSGSRIVPSLLNEKCVIYLPENSEFVKTNEYKIKINDKNKKERIIQAYHLLYIPPNESLCTLEELETETKIKNGIDEGTGKKIPLNVLDLIDTLAGGQKKETKKIKKNDKENDKKNNEEKKDSEINENDMEVREWDEE